MRSPYIQRYKAMASLSTVCVSHHQVADRKEASAGSARAVRRIFKRTAFRGPKAASTATSPRLFVWCGGVSSSHLFTGRHGRPVMGPPVDPEARCWSRIDGQGDGERHVWGERVRDKGKAARQSSVISESVLAPASETLLVFSNCFSPLPLSWRFRRCVWNKFAQSKP